ncbi:MAG: flagellar basal body L-ring protein FlgH [candidate division Zixibacteria bacterium]|nr:flagellar basal body L-ring protein FlgH [candidate division Zixibacteria bacterium]
MNFKKVVLLLAVLLLLPFTLKVWSGDFGQATSLFTDIKANRVGDILTVLIYESSNASTQSETKTQKTGEFSTSGGPGTGSLRFLPIFGVNGENESKHQGKGENLRSQSLRGKMTVTVVGVKDNGDLVVRGSRTIGISNDKETMTLTGIVRQKDIKPDNTIESYLLADAEISYTGKGAANTASRPGILMRFLDWIF